MPRLALQNGTRVAHGADLGENFGSTMRSLTATIM
jgi:hypothetical protein